MDAGRAVAGIVLAGVLVAGPAGCGGEEPSVSPSASSSTVSPPPSTSSSSPTTRAPGATTGRLPALLLELAEAARVVRDRSAITSAQRALQDAAAATRTGLRATREAAFGGSTRNCGTVGERASSTRDSADIAVAAANTLDPMLDTRQGALDRLAAVIAAVEAEGAARPATATSPTPTELTAALDVAGAEHTTGIEALAGFRANASDGRTKAGEMAAQAQEIYASAC